MIAGSDGNRRSGEGGRAPEPHGGRKDELWEAAYTSLESPRAEIRRYKRRLRNLGVGRWRRDAAIVELFCGRGNGLHALRELGFTNLTGADLSATLLRRYRGPARLVRCDCRTLPFAAESVDVVIVLGGLHHLPGLPVDVAATLAEVRRVLRRDGWLLAIEPWRTPFLALVHWLCRRRLARRLWPKLAALATMIHYEQPTYDQWLAAADALAPLFERCIEVEHRSVRWGKLRLLGRKRPSGRDPSGS
ncbi:MAG: class I SAM-dependent methyltransferase [Candidatus Tectomicrobia bacterium]|nr:class I SAM-dependent methyltransferase [Candidatus Tectomicrobia bacterium]